MEVAAVNDLPVFTSIPTTDKSDGTYSWNDESEYLYRVKAYDSDWDWQTLELNVTSVLPDWLTFRQDSNGTGLLWGTGAVKDKGTYRIEFTATDSNGTSVKQVFDLVLRIDNYPPVFKSLTTNEEISELVVYLDEDSQAGGVRGWVTPQDFHAEDPDPELQVPARDLEWSLGSLPSSLAHAEVNGTGVRPQVFQYQVVDNFFGEDLFHLKAFDGHRYALLPVRVQVLPGSGRSFLCRLGSERHLRKGWFALVGTLEHKGSGRRQSQDRSCRASRRGGRVLARNLRHERDKRDGCAARGSASWDSG